MRTFNSLITVFTLLAVAVNPVAAAWVPCCCTPAKKVESKPPCCAVDYAQPEHACDFTAEHAPESVGAKPLSGCCCFTAPPVRTLRDSVSKLSVGQPQFAVVWPTVEQLVVPAMSLSQPFTAPGLLSGPSLLAQYCIWLK